MVPVRSTFRLMKNWTTRTPLPSGWRSFVFAGQRLRECRGSLMKTNMDRGMFQWMMGHAKRNHFMWEASHDWPDIVQEGHATLVKLEARYPGANIKRTMGLFKTAFRNRLCDIGRKNAVAFPIIIEADLAGDYSLTDLSDAITYTHPDISDRLALLPDALRRALFALSDDPRALKSFLWIDGDWETPADKVCRLAGMPKGTPVLDMLRTVLLGEDPNETYFPTSAALMLAK